MLRKSFVYAPHFHWRHFERWWRCWICSRFQRVRYHLADEPSQLHTRTSSAYGARLARIKFSCHSTDIDRYNTRELRRYLVRKGYWLSLISFSVPSHSHADTHHAASPSHFLSIFDISFDTLFQGWYLSYRKSHHMASWWVIQCHTAWLYEQSKVSLYNIINMLSLWCCFADDKLVQNWQHNATKHTYNIWYNFGLALIFMYTLSMAIWHIDFHISSCRHACLPLR